MTLTIRDVPGVRVGHATDAVLSTGRAPAPEGLGGLLSLGVAAVESLRTAIERSVAVG